MFILIFFVILLLLIILYKLEQNKYKGIKDIPGPPSFPLIGNSFTFGFTVQSQFAAVLNNQIKYGSFVRIWPIWLQPVVFINDADALSILLNSIKYIDKGREYKFLHAWLGTGLLTSTGSKWQKRRKLLTPSFHFKILEEFIQTFSTESDSLINILKKQAKQQTLNIYPFINLCALDIICKTTMATSLNAQSGREVPYAKAVKEYLRILQNREFSVWKNFDVLFQISGDAKRLKLILKTLHSFSNAIITKRIKELQEINKPNSDDGNGKRKTTAFIDLLIQASEGGEKSLSMEDIREEVDTFMFAGHDTITSAISFTLYEISKHPEVQEKIYNEIKSVLSGSSENLITYAHLQELSYLGLTIKEGLRLYPPVALFGRELQEDAQIGKYRIPRGTTVFANVFSLQRQDKYFENPDEFNPDRFSKSSTIGYHPFCYLPFSAGPRNCIGQKFGMLEMKMIITKILLNFRLVPAEPGHDLVLYFNGILKSLSGINIKIEDRQRL